MKKSRKVLSVLLSLLLVVTSIPFVVIATAEEGYEVSASDSGSVELKGTALKWTQKLTYAGEGLFNLNLTATANSNTMFESVVRSKVENNYFVAKNAGYYLVELWGGAGAEGESTSGSGSQGGNGGDAGYVYGYIYLDEGDILYSSIGGQGKQVAKSDPGDSAANEGGVHGDTGSYKVGGGGGYSALYLFHADEKDSFESKYVNADGTMNPINEEDRTTRYIMIAGGGGGGGTSNSLIHNRRSLLSTRQTGTADGGNGGTMTSPSGKITTGVPGTFYAGSDGKSSGKNTDYVGMGGTNLPGEITETAHNRMGALLEFFGIDSSKSAQPNDWTGLYNPDKEGGYGGDGNLRGGAGGAGFAGGSGGLMPNYGSANAYYIGGGGGGSSFVADTVSTNLTSDMKARLVGSNYSEQGGQSVVTYLGEEVVEEGGFDFSHLKDVSFTGTLSQYFSVVSVKSVDETGADNGVVTFDETGFTVSGANVLNEEAAFSGNKISIDVTLTPCEAFAGGNGVPVLNDIVFTDNVDGSKTLAAADSVKYANVPLDFSLKGKSYIITEETTFALSELCPDEYASVRANLAADPDYDFITSISDIEYFDGATQLNSAVTVKTNKKIIEKLTVVPKIGTPAVVGPVQTTQVFESYSDITSLTPGGVSMVGTNGSMSGTNGKYSKTLKEDGNGNYTLGIEFTQMKAATADYSIKLSEKSVEDSSTYEAPFTGWYALQAWGACGGKGGKGGGFMGLDGHDSGTGGYVSAYIRLNAGDKLTLTNGANGAQGIQASDTGDTGDAGDPGEYSAIKIKNGSGDYDYLVIAGGGGGGAGYGFGGDRQNGESVNNSATPNTEVGDPGQYNGQANSNYRSHGSAGKNFRSADCYTALPDGIDVQREITLAQGNYSVPNDSNPAHGGATRVVPIAADPFPSDQKASEFFNISITESITKYFDVTGSSVTVDGTSAKSYDFNTSVLENGATECKFTNIRLNVPNSVSDENTVELNGKVVVSVTFKAKEGFLGGNDVSALLNMTFRSNAGTANEYVMTVPSNNVTDYVNVTIDEYLTGDITAVDKTVTCGETVNNTDLYDVNYEYPTGDDLWKADFVDFAVTPDSGSFAPVENTVVPVKFSITPKTEVAQKAKTVASVSGAEYTALANVTVKYTVDISSDVVDIDGDSTVVCGNDYNAVLKPASGYTLPETITVKAGEDTLTAGTDYTYDDVTGALVINAAAISGNVSIEITPIAKTYTIKFIDSSDLTEVLTPVKKGEFMTGASLAEIISWAKSYAEGKDAKEGHHFEWDEIPAEMPGNDLIIFGDYEPNRYTLTIHYVDGEGTPVDDDYVADTWYGSEYKVISPKVGDLVPDEVLVSGTIGDMNTEITVHYDYKPYTLSIFYLYSSDNTDDTASTRAAADVYVDGENFSFDSPVFGGYTASVAAVTGTKDADGEVVYVVYYTQNEHTEQNEHTVTGTLDANGKVVYVYYTQNEYTVTYYADEDATVTLAEQTVLYNDVYGYDATAKAYGTLPTAIKTGYRFDGWYKDLEDESTLVSSDTVYDVLDNTTLCAKFTIEQHTINILYVYTEDDGSEPPDPVLETLNYGAHYSHTTPHITGYSADKEVVAGTVGNANELIYVHYDLIVHTMEELEKAIADAKALDEEDYTGSTRADLIEAVENGEDVVEKGETATVKEISIATEAILEEVLKDEIDNLLDDADEIKKGDDYEDVDLEKKQALDDAIAAAEKILNQTDPEPTKEELKEARDNLQDAINDVLKDELQNLIDGTDVLEKDDYTVDSWDELEEKIQAAKDVLEKTDPAATEEEIKQAIEDLKKAIEDLIDRSELKDAIGDGNAIKGTDAYDDLDDEHKQALEEALEEAQKVYDNPSATEQEIADAKAAIDEAIKDILKDAIDKAEALDEYDYSESSWNDLQGKVDNGKDVYADDTATPDDIRKAAKDILNAIDNLVDLTELEKELSIAESLDPNKFTDDVAEELAEKIAEAEAVYNDPDATQEKVDEAAEMLAEAVEKLISKGNYRKYNAEKDAADELDNEQNIYDSEAFEAYKKAVEEIDKGLSRNLVRREQSIIDKATQDLKDAKAELEANGRNSVLTFVDENGDELKVIGVTPGTKFSEAGAPELPLGNNIYYYAGWLDGEGNLIAADTAMTSDMTITRAREFKILVVKGDSGLSLKQDVNSGIDYVVGLEAGTTVADTLAKLENDETVLEVRSFEDNELAGLDLVGTGSYAILKSKYTGEIYGQWAFIVMGDVDGDGDIDANDYSRSKDVALGREKFADNQHYFFFACDCYTDDVIDVCDAFEISRMKVAYEANHQ